MLDFMNQGGMLMWPLLGLGLLAIATALRNVVTGGEVAESSRRLAMGVLTGALAWSALGLTRVAAAGALPGPVVRGIGECMCPTTLGLAVFAVVSLLSALAPRQLS